MFETPNRPSRVMWNPRGGSSVRNQPVARPVRVPAEKGVSREFLQNCFES